MPGNKVQSQQQMPFPVMNGPYLGLPAPGQDPVIFAPQLFEYMDQTYNSFHFHSAPVFTPEGNEVYFSAYYPPGGSSSRKQAVFVMKLVNEVWTKPVPAGFSGEFSNGSPFLSSDGNRFYFNSNRPSEPGGKATDVYCTSLWYVNKTGTGWGEPVYIGFKSDIHESTLSVSNTGVLYFSANYSGSQGPFDIYRSVLEESGYSEPKSIGRAINRGFIKFSPFIAPDESFIIFAYSGNYSKKGLHISYKKPDGNWGPTINLGNKINAGSSQRFPGLSPDGKYFFFSSSRDGKEKIYWVSASFIQELNPDKQY